ncbi:hypothetical protein Tco_1320316 [Tanacetum coccineum]
MTVGLSLCNRSCYTFKAATGYGSSRRSYLRSKGDIEAKLVTPRLQPKYCEEKAFKSLRKSTTVMVNFLEWMTDLMAVQEGKPSAKHELKDGLEHGFKA